MFSRILFWFLFSCSVIWGPNLPGITIQNLGTLYPLRLFVLFMSFILFSMFLKGIYKKINLEKRSEKKTYDLLVLIIKNIIEKINSKNSLLKTTYIFIIIMLSYGSVTLLWTVSLNKAISSLIVYSTSFLIVVICTSFIKDIQSLSNFAKGYTLNVIIICAIGIYESLTGNYLFYFTDHNYTLHLNTFGLYRPLVMFYNINNLAVFVVLSIPICFAAFEYSNFKLLKRGFVFLLCLANVILSGSRAALLGVILIIILYTVYIFKNKKKFIRIGLLTILFLTIGMILKTNSLVYQSLLEDPRIIIWENTLKNSIDYYFMGVGPGNTININSISQHVDTNGIYDAHNYLLEILCEFGIIGLSAFLIWIFKIFFEIKRLIKRVDRSNKYLLFQFLIYICLFVLLSIGPSSMRGMYFIWLVFGIGIAKINIIKNKFFLTQ